MSGSAFGRVQASSLVKGVFPDGQQTRYHLYYIINQRTLLGTCYIFSASLPLQYLSVCICINKRGLMFALRWASIQCSSQFSYLTRNDFIVFTVSTIGNRENFKENFRAFFGEIPEIIFGLISGIM